MQIIRNERELLITRERSPDRNFAKSSRALQKKNADKFDVLGQDLLCMPQIHENHGFYATTTGEDLEKANSSGERGLRGLIQFLASNFHRNLSRSFFLRKF